MAILDNTLVEGIYNANPDDGNFDPVPAGLYSLMISKTDVAQTKSGTGTYVKIEFTITGPAYQNRKLWEIFNIRHESSQAENIGRANLKALCLACGITEKLTDTNMLLNHAVSATITIEQSKDPKYPAPQNRVKNYKPMTSGFSMPAQAQAQAAPVQAASAPVSDNPLSWLK